jgi:hypothetical protein
MINGHANANGWQPEATPMNQAPMTPTKPRYDDGPFIESSITPSKNGRLIISRITISSVKPASYWEAVLRTARERREANIQSDLEVLE